MIEKLLDNWELVTALVELLLLALLGKWAIVRARVNKLLVKQAEGEVTKVYREKVARAVEDGLETGDVSPSEADVISNLAAESDPSPRKKPESRRRRAAKFIGRAALGILKGRLGL